MAVGLQHTKAKYGPSGEGNVVFFSNKICFTHSHSCSTYSQRHKIQMPESCLQHTDTNCAQLVCPGFPDVAWRIRDGSH